MKPLHTPLLPALVLTAGLILASILSAAEAPSAAPVTTTSAVDKAHADYPLENCVVSGEKLEVSDMGEPFDYIHTEEGKPDRLVRFCCKSCLKTFKKAPAKYLKKIDDAASAKAAQARK